MEQGPDEQRGGDWIHPTPQGDEDRGMAPWSKGELWQEVLRNPGAAFAYGAETRPVAFGFLTYWGVTVFSSLMGMLLWKRNLPPETAQWLEGAIGDAASLVVYFIMALKILLGPVFFFLGVAVYNLLGEVFGGQGNGKGLLANMGLAHLPGVFLPPVQLILLLMPLGGYALALEQAFSLIIWFWVAVLTVMAINRSLGISLGHAFAVYILPGVVWYVLLLMIIILIIGQFAAGAALLG